MRQVAGRQAGHIEAQFFEVTSQIACWVACQVASQVASQITGQIVEPAPIRLAVHLIGDLEIVVGQHYEIVQVFVWVAFVGERSGRFALRIGVFIGVRRRGTFDDPRARILFER